MTLLFVSSATRVRVETHLLSLSAKHAAAAIPSSCAHFVCGHRRFSRPTSLRSGPHGVCGVRQRPSPNKRHLGADFIPKTAKIFRWCLDFRRKPPSRTTKMSSFFPEAASLPGRTWARPTSAPLVARQTWTGRRVAACRCLPGYPAAVWAAEGVAQAASTRTGATAQPPNPTPRHPPAVAPK